MKKFLTEEQKNNYKHYGAIVIKNVIDNFENHINPNDPTNNCLDVAIITTPEKRTQKTKEKLKTVAGRVLNKWKKYFSYC